jgi:hypothetical protein
MERCEVPDTLQGAEILGLELRLSGLPPRDRRGRQG